MLQHQVYPLLHQRWAAVPIERMLPDDDIVLEKQRLLGLHLNVVVGIELIHIADGHMVQRMGHVNKALIHPAVLKPGMEEEDEDLFFGHCLDLKVLVRPEITHWDDNAQDVGLCKKWGGHLSLPPSCHRSRRSCSRYHRRSLSPCPYENGSSSICRSHLTNMPYV